MFSSPSNSLNLTAELLGLSGIKVVRVRTDLSAREIIIEVKSTQKLLSCRVCSKPTIGHGLGRKLRLRHLPMFGKETFIEITPRRGQCVDCDGRPTTTETLDWYEAKAKFTKPFEQHLLFELVNSTVADVSRKEAVDYHAIESLIDDHIETEVDFSTIQSLGVVGIDEISIKKGYRDFVTIITYRIKDKVHLLGMIKGREKDDIVAFLQKIPSRLGDNTLAFCCDLYDGYLNACKEVFNKIPVVADRFHVRKLYGKSLVNLRKSELTRLKKGLSPTEYAALKPAIAVLRKQKDYFTEEEKSVVERLFAVAPKLKLGYQYSRKLSGIFDSHTSIETAKEKITEWIDMVFNSELNCFDNFIKTLVKYKQQITNYFGNRYNSGFVEGFNNKVKVLKRRCYGLSNVKRIFQRVIVDTMGLDRFAPEAPAF